MAQRAGVLAGWLAFAAATERWRPWGDGVRLEYAGDVHAYESIARAAPGFPKHRVDVVHSDRFVPHWLVGEIAHVLHLGLHTVYQVATGSILVAVVLVVAATLAATGAALATQALCLGALVTSAYPFRYLAEAPGMVTDAVFLLGLAVTVHGLVTRRARWIVLGLAVATLGRQTGLPLAIAVAALLLARRAWRTAVEAAVAALVVYYVPHHLSSSWADHTGRQLLGMSVIGGGVTLHTLAVHLGRCLIALVIPFALLGLGWWRGRVRPALAPLLLGLVTLAEVVVLAPDWTHSEPRLAGLAAPALIVAAAPALNGARLGRWVALPVAGVALASFHHLYSVFPLAGAAGWGVLVAAGAALVLVPAWRRVDEVHEEGRSSFFASAERHAPFLSAVVEGAVYAIRTDDRGVGRKLFVTRSRPEFEVLRRVMSVIGTPAPDSTIVDVGANIGTTTIPALVAHGFAHAVACEPGAEACRMLRLNVAANGLADMVEVVPAAVSNTSGEVTLAVDTSAFGTRRIGASGVTVAAVTLDDIVDASTVGLLWIDAQGHEGHVLDGASSLLDAGVPVVLALRRQKLLDAGGLEMLLEILEAHFAQVVDLRSPGVRDPCWQPVFEPIGAVRKYLDERRRTDILVLPERWS